MTRPLALALFGALCLSACGDSDADSVAGEAAAPGIAAPAAGDFTALGTEPFWNVQVRGQKLTLSRPDHPDVAATAPRPEALGETLVFWGDAFNLTIMTRECSDGMSDRKYPYEAEVRIGDEVLKGCADKAGANAAPQS